MTFIYGVDIDRPVSPKDVRDGIVECFAQAHKEQLDKLKNHHLNVPCDEFEEIKKIEVRQILRKMFEDTGGDYDNPTKESILKALEKLKELALNFRDKSIVEKHYNEILGIIKKLSYN